MSSFALKRFYAGTFPNGGPTTLFTVPAGHQYLLKNATIDITGGVNGTHIALMVTGRTVGYRTISATQKLVEDFCAQPFATGAGRADNIVLEPGDTLQIETNTGASGTIHVSGADYTI